MCVRAYDVTRECKCADRFDNMYIHDMYIGERNVSGYVVHRDGEFVGTLNNNIDIKSCFYHLESFCVSIVICLLAVTAQMNSVA